MTFRPFYAHHAKKNDPVPRKSCMVSKIFAKLGLYFFSKGGLGFRGGPEPSSDVKLGGQDIHPRTSWPRKCNMRSTVCNTINQYKMTVRSF